MIKIYKADGTTEFIGAGAYQNVLVDDVIGGEKNTFIYSVKYPLSYIYSTADPKDWYTNSEAYQNDALWNNGTNKSSFDPCPKGWRVPPIGTWSDFTRTADAEKPLNGTFPFYANGTANENVQSGDYYPTNGRLYKVSNSGMGSPIAWYPASGQCGYNSGYRLFGGRETDAWSASVGTDIKAHYMGGTASILVPNATHYRSIGFPVRCVQE